MIERWRNTDREMYRSASWSRVPDEYSMHTPPKAASDLRLPTSEKNDELPPYDDPMPEISKKERCRVKFAENAVHVIPFVLLLCGFILWIFSNPDVNVGNKAGDSIAARIEGLTIEGDIDTDSDGTQTSLMPMDPVDMDSSNQIINHAVSKLRNKFK